MSLHAYCDGCNYEISDHEEVYCSGCLESSENNIPRTNSRWDEKKPDLKRAFDLLHELRWETEPFSRERGRIDDVIRLIDPLVPVSGGAR